MPASLHPLVLQAVSQVVAATCERGRLQIFSFSTRSIPDLAGARLALKRHLADLDSFRGRALEGPLPPLPLGSHNETSREVGALLCSAPQKPEAAIHKAPSSWSLEHAASEHWRFLRWGTLLSNRGGAAVWLMHERLGLVHMVQDPVRMGWFACLPQGASCRVSRQAT